MNWKEYGRKWFSHNLLIGTKETMKNLTIALSGPQLNFIFQNTKQ
jgi:hypothetical protein